jgi:isopenicillin N synthase-like dioxygenase
MVKFTNGELKSGKHRVVPAPGKQASIERYSIVYFVRPGDDVLMEPLEAFRANGAVQVAGKFSGQYEEGTVFKAGEWMQRRGLQLGS